MLSDRVGTDLGPSGDLFSANETSNQLMDESLVADIPLPCYIINATEISDNAGPLECGALVDDFPCNTINLGNDGSVFFVGVQSWWVCDVNATQPYGIVPGTVVGGFTTSEPSGPGIRDYSAVDALKLASGGGNHTTSSTMSMTSAAASSSAVAASSSATGSETNTLTTDRMTTMTSPTSTSSQATKSASASGTTATGAASHNIIQDVSKVAMLIAGGLASLL